MAFTISSEKMSQLKSEGFVALRQACALEETTQIRATLEDLYARKVGAKEGALFDVLKPSEENALTLGQLTNPSDFAPALRKTAYAQKANEIAKQILGPESFCYADIVLMKPPHSGAATPWHQDQAFRKLNYESDELTFWLPLQDVDEDSGCMQFVPGTHIGPITPHRSPNDDLQAHGLESCYKPSAEEIVSVPMTLGDFSIHDGRVLHGSPSNGSSVTRYAYIRVYRNPVVPPPGATPYPWVQQRQDVNSQRRKEWLRSGGYLVAFWRRLRKGEFSNLSRLRLAMRVAFLRYKNK